MTSDQSAGASSGGAKHGSGSLEHETARHLTILRSLLHRDYLTRASWSEAFQDLARIAREALGAGEALVGFFSTSSSSWTAITTGGALIGQDEISSYGSLSVLDRVRESGRPVLTTADEPLTMTSSSLARLRVENVLAVPLFGWDVVGSASTRRLEGCLYVHRTMLDPPFTPHDVELVLDITAIIQHHLNLLRRMHDLEMTLDLSRAELKGLREAVHQSYRLGRYDTLDAEFAERVLAPLQGVARADRVAILILGPTGSGKSYLAQAYHYECARRDGPFVVLDCSQVTSSETLAAELFGYAPRSGYANAPPIGRPGKAQLAHKGTLFIDEIGCLPLDLQQRLLRLIQTGYFSPLGSSEEKQADIQVIAATNEALPELIREKRFREDLYWRIAELVVELPPLSGRRPDIPRFAQRFLEDARARYGRHEVQGLTPAALARLVRHDWARAGNLRGLEHTMNRSLLLAPPGITLLDAAHLRLDAMPGLPVAPSSGGAAPEMRSTAGLAAGASPGAPAGASAGSGVGASVGSSAGSGVGAPAGASAGSGVGAPAGSVAGAPAGASSGSVAGTSFGASAGSGVGASAGSPAGSGADSVPGRGGDSWDDAELEAVRAAIRKHGSATHAALALGITRDALVWQLRRANLTVGDILPAGQGKRRRRG